jgi:pyrroline-5-carboxylate reductase
MQSDKSTRQEKKISFVGGGNMAAALLHGLVANGHNKDKLWVTDHNEHKLEGLSLALGVHTSKDPLVAVKDADVVVFAVKPFDLKEAMQVVVSTISKHPPLILSVATGVHLHSMTEWLGFNTPIVRCMPNAAAMLNCGATGLFANSDIKEEDRSFAESIMRIVGITVWVEKEELLDAVTAVSGSGPAYYLYFTEALIAAGEKLGLDSETASLLARQTALGAARMGIEVQESLEILRERITSPKGTTEQAISSFDSNQFATIIDEAVQAAYARCKALSKAKES